MSNEISIVVFRPKMSFLGCLRKTKFHKWEDLKKPYPNICSELKNPSWEKEKSSENFFAGSYPDQLVVEVHIFYLLYAFNCI